jgi:hypothetical protein
VDVEDEDEESNIKLSIFKEFWIRLAVACTPFMADRSFSSLSSSSSSIVCLFATDFIITFCFSTPLYAVLLVKRATSLES